MNDSKAFLEIAIEYTSVAILKMTSLLLFVINVIICFFHISTRCREWCHEIQVSKFDFFVPFDRSAEI